jgi:serine-type D-Ala-D-Ala carboxypeptidase/endopeptidase
VLPDRDQVIVVLTSNGSAAIGDLRSALLASRYPLTADNVTADSAPVDPQRLPDYAGVYRSDDGAALTLVVQDGALWARPVGLGFERLQGAGDDRFTRRNLTLYEFDRVDGQVQGLRSSGGGVERSFRRTAEPAPAVARQSAELLQAYVGRYSGSGLDFSVQQQDGVLRVKLGDQPRFPVFPVPGDPDRFAYDVVQAELQFERYANGQVRALVLHQNGARRSAQRVD